MSNLNLVGKEYQDIEDFITDFIEDKESLVIETGEYGFLLFHKAVEKRLFYLGWDLGSEVIDTEHIEPSENKLQFVVYEFKEKKVKIRHNPELDKYNKEDINEITGFTNTSSTIYIKTE